MLDLKGNFSNKYWLDIACRVFKVQVECQEHILKCVVLKKNIDVPKHAVYEDIFKEVRKKKTVTPIFKDLIDIRKRLENIPSTSDQVLKTSIALLDCIYNFSSGK